MIKSLNATIDERNFQVYIEELDEREEFVCVGQACFLVAEVCVGQACAVACFGISACAVGIHAW